MFMLQHQQNLLIQYQHILAERRRRMRVVWNIWVRDWIARGPQLGLYDRLMVELCHEDPRAFQNFMRMPPAMYDDIVQRLTPALTKETTNWRAPLEPGLKVAITLRHLASGFKYHEMEYAWRVLHNTISLVVREVCEAIVHEYAPEMLSPPETDAQWRQLADDWYQRWHFPHVIGVTYGKHIACKAPANTGSDYFNYKGFFNVILLAVVSSDNKFLWIDVSGKGSSSDAYIFNGKKVISRRVCRTRTSLASHSQILCQVTHKLYPTSW